MIESRRGQFLLGSLVADERMMTMRNDCILYAVALGQLGGLLTDVLELVLEVTHNNHTQYPTHNYIISNNRHSSSLLSVSFFPFTLP